MNLKISTTLLCIKTGMSRPNYYKGQKKRARREVDADLIEELVKAERSVQPRLGGKKLHRWLKPELEKAGVRIGRDRFSRSLANADFCLSRCPRHRERRTAATACRYSGTCFRTWS